MDLNTVQPRSQGLSLPAPKSGGERDPGNEVEVERSPNVREYFAILVVLENNDMLLRFLLGTSRCSARALL